MAKELIHEHNRDPLKASLHRHFLWWHIAHFIRQGEQECGVVVAHEVAPLGRVQQEVQGLVRRLFGEGVLEAAGRS